MTDGAVQAFEVVYPGVKKMQGALVRDGVFLVSSSDPKTSWPQAPGSMFVGSVGDEVAERGWPAWPEDLHYSPFSDNLWSLTEMPQIRFVFAVKLAAITAGCAE